MKLTNTQDKKLTSISALVHGDSGCGKSTSATTLSPEYTFILNGERGTLAMREKPFPVLQFTSWDDIQVAYQMFSKPDAIEDKTIKEAVQKTRVLFIDSLSECADLCIKQIIQVERKTLTRRRTGDKEDAPPNIYADLMTWEDWGLYKNRMLKMISAFTHLPINIIFTCLSAWSKDKQGSDVYRVPNLGGKTALECPAYFDEVLHMESQEDSSGELIRVWRTFYDGEIIAKDASGVLDPFEETDWPKLFAKILAPKPKGKKDAKSN